jgi:hypothetical protein
MQLLTFASMETHKTIINVNAKWIDLDTSHTLVAKIKLDWTKFILVIVQYKVNSKLCVMLGQLHPLELASDPLCKAQCTNVFVMELGCQPCFGRHNFVCVFIDCHIHPIQKNTHNY